MGLLDWILGKKKEVEVVTPRHTSQIWSYCEADFPTYDCVWCIRRLSSKGRTNRHNLGDRIDTPSLCGRVKPREGWDLLQVVQEDLVLDKRACPKCRILWLERMKGSGLRP